MFRTKAATTAVAVLACSFAALASAQKLPIETIQLRGDRFHGLSYAEMAPEQRVFLDHTVNSARSVNNTTANGPFNVLMRSPEIGDLSQALGNSIRFSSGLSGKVRELATLMAGRAWSSHYEWYAHARYAKQEGLPDDVIAAIAGHRAPDFKHMSADETLAWRVTDEMLYTRQITDATYKEALAALGERALMSTVVIAAYYEYISMLLNVDRYPLPADAPKSAASALTPLGKRSLIRKPEGTVTARTPLKNADTDHALDELRARISVEQELPAVLRDLARNLVMTHWDDPPTEVTRGRVSRELKSAEAFAVELLNTREVSDDTFMKALGALGERKLVNLIVFMGYANVRCAQKALAGSECSI
ncbi:MAG: carboxymuconolactone decarboxylase family protein [Gammaproteobacteria bacterium]